MGLFFRFHQHISTLSTVTTSNHEAILLRESWKLPLGPKALPLLRCFTYLQPWETAPKAPGPELRSIFKSHNCCRSKEQALARKSSWYKFSSGFKTSNLTTSAGCDWRLGTSRGPTAGPPPLVPAGAERWPRSHPRQRPEPLSTKQPKCPSIPENLGFGEGLARARRDQKLENEHGVGNKL